MKAYSINKSTVSIDRYTNCPLLDAMVRYIVWFPDENTDDENDAMKPE